MTDKNSEVGFVVTAWRFTKRWIRRIGFTFGGLFILYLLIALIGLIPVNNEFAEASEGVEIAIFSGQFHSDIILPLRHQSFDWSTEFKRNDFREDIYEATHVSIGWGERNFYLNTPRWEDLKLSTAAKALFVPSNTVMHVSMTTRPSAEPNVRRLTISEEQYAALVTFIRNSFDRDKSDAVMRIEGARYGNYDAFYEARGSYHAFRTCNCWAGNAMKSAGIRVGWFTPFPKSVFMYLPGESTDQ